MSVPKSVQPFWDKFRAGNRAAKVKVYAVEANNQNFDRLEAELAKMA